MSLPVMFLQELTRARVVEELEEIESACDEAIRGGPIEPVQQRIRELKLVVERIGITEA